MHHIELIGSYTSAATLSGEEIKITTRKDPVPVLCRELIKRGVDPNQRVKVTRAGQPVWKTDLTVGYWAGIDITEDDREGLRTAKYRPFPKDI
ncbi:hypothetical protein ACFX5Q_23415 [Mesorhizobium sp. IMUNJ 23033]|uniref:hypothetical protein n=1 Tax=Mesorhizobium sp. IMUNJ 23033 TaxID=3378039 RepID=UPI00384B5335